MRLTPSGAVALSPRRPIFIFSNRRCALRQAFISASDVCPDTSLWGHDCRAGGGGAGGAIPRMRNFPERDDRPLHCLPNMSVVPIVAVPERTALRNRARDRFNFPFLCRHFFRSHAQSAARQDHRVVASSHLASGKIRSAPRTARRPRGRLRSPAPPPRRRKVLRPARRQAAQQPTPRRPKRDNRPRTPTHRPHAEPARKETRPRPSPIASPRRAPPG